MPRLHQTTTDAATGGVADLYEQVARQFGKVPNGIQVLGSSEEALRGYLAFAGGVSRGRLRGADRERIAIAVATFNGCDYCLAGHTAAAEAFRVDAADRASAQHFRSADPRSDAIHLWPEHFDVAIELGEATFGVSPGDENHPEPYAYVAPWNPPPPGDFWN